MGLAGGIEKAGTIMGVACDMGGASGTVAVRSACALAGGGPLAVRCRRAAGAAGASVQAGVVPVAVGGCAGADAVAAGAGAVGEAAVACRRAARNWRRRWR